MRKQLIYFIIIACFIAGCKQEHLTPEAYKTYSVENKEDYIFTKELPKYTFSAEYQPAELLALNELDNQNNISKGDFELKLSEFSGLQYYVFKMQLNGSELDLLQEGIASESQYTERVQYLSFNISQDFQLVQGDDTLSCIMHHFERNYGLAPYIKLSLAFENKGLKEDRTLIYNDNIFNSGIIKIEIPQNEINKIPNVIFK